ncbi:hypothetical protein NO995_08375 [Aestuariibaculum sp. M13]|uniref:hypothetical protein n=1 Tax=Aestuariibaculum sp. M13 TaxID=2967132 RepID=UPI002159F06B|nr:hypothetical protein [Aestuariibaculum sp. M13]MCR8667695.1 hypothetical protein [Aestuariibaculum sp. M13]
MIIDYKREKVFPLMFLIIGITLLISGILLIVNFDKKAIAGLSFLVIGLIIVFTRKGTLIDFEKKKTKHYVGLFLIKIGNWKTLENYSYVTLLHLNLKSHGYSRTGVQFSEKNKVFRVCLLDKTHREKIKIKDFKNIESANLEAKKIAKKMNYDFVKYNPT